MENLEPVLTVCIFNQIPRWLGCPVKFVKLWTLSLLPQVWLRPHLASTPSTPMKLLPLVLLMTSNQGTQWLFFYQSSHFVSLLHFTEVLIPSFGLWHRIFSWKLCCLYGSFIGSFPFLSLLSVGNLLPSCPSTRVLSSAHSSHSVRSFLVILAHILLTSKTNSGPFFSV